jgi:rod shape-determining protein MreC
MDTLLGRYKNLIVLAAILFAQIIALAVQVRRPAQWPEPWVNRLNLHRRFVSAAMEPSSPLRRIPTKGSALR